MIKLLIGGSPCTFWSIAQKSNRETTADGLGWELFKNYLVAKEKFKPDFFLYENNKSAAQAIKDQIKKELKVYDGTLFMEDSGSRYIEINSALVSAQNRQRFYVHNCGNVEQPQDSGILLKDILETENSVVGVGYRNRRESDGKLYRRYETSGIEKSNALTTVQTDSMIAEPVYELSEEYYKGGADSSLIGMTRNGEGKYRNGSQPSPQYRIYSCNGKSQVVNTLANENYICPIRVGTMPQNNGALKDGQATRIYSVDGKSCTQNANGGGWGAKTGLHAVPVDSSKSVNYPIYEVKDGKITIKGKEYPIKLADGFYIIRKLTVTECCRLQTMPDDYCRAVSNAQAYKGLGNGWTAEVIIHILNGALKDVPRDEEIVVLSMYDGIGTGRYCLDKMGFTNVKYYAYEIDKYAKQIAMSNYPDIIQMGDAFDLRNPDWTIGY